MPTRRMSVEACPPVVRGQAIWLHDGNTAYPVAYLRKPKGITDEQFKAVCRGLELFLPDDFEALKGGKP
jgi:hypothetical protein